MTDPNLAAPRDAKVRDLLRRILFGAETQELFALADLLGVVRRESRANEDYQSVTCGDVADALLPAERGREALDLIASERERQVSKEGWTVAHDDEHADESLATVASIYARPSHQRGSHLSDRYPLGHLPSRWPVSWAWEWWKPTPSDRVRELVKAGALIVAEIERLQRAALSPDAGGKP